MGETDETEGCGGNTGGRKGKGMDGRKEGRMNRRADVRTEGRKEGRVPRIPRKDDRDGRIKESKVDFQKVR